jgi:hypothetical protein
MKVAHVYRLSQDRRPSAFFLCLQESAPGWPPPRRLPETRREPDRARRGPHARLSQDRRPSGAGIGGPRKRMPSAQTTCKGHAEAFHCPHIFSGICPLDTSHAFARALRPGIRSGTNAVNAPSSARQSRRVSSAIVSGEETLCSRGARNVKLRLRHSRYLLRVRTPPAVVGARCNLPMQPFRAHLGGRKRSVRSRRQSSRAVASPSAGARMGAGRVKPRSCPRADA